MSLFFVQVGFLALPKSPVLDLLAKPQAVSLTAIIPLPPATQWAVP